MRTISYLENISKKEKCDFHCHAARGGSISYLEKICGCKIIPQLKFDTITDMNVWYKKNIETFFPGAEGYELLIHATIKQAIEDHVSCLVLSFAIDRIRLYDYDINLFIDRMKQIVNAYDNISIVPELAIAKTSEYRNNIKWGNVAIETGFFKCIDIVGEEQDVEFVHFIELFHKAKRLGLVCRAHVGEFGSGDSVLQVCKLLQLDEVQHGINACESRATMDYLKENNIVLNICPSSNVMMGVVDQYQHHPIKKFVDYGIKVTINTDDRAVFNNSVSEEYNNLFINGVLSVKELEDIRVYSLSRSKYYKSL